MKNKFKALLALMTVLGVTGAASACDIQQYVPDQVLDTIQQYVPDEVIDILESVGVITPDDSEDVSKDPSDDNSKDSSSTKPDETEYTVTFKADGKVVGTATYTTANKKITEPAVPTKEHYTGVWESYTLVKGNVTVNAVYTAIEYTVNFVADDVDVATETYTVEDTSIAVPSVPAKEHYKEGVWEDYELTGGNITVNAVYTAIEYHVNFVADNVDIATETYTIEDTEITVPEVPAKDHYIGEWKAYELTGGDITVEAVYTAIEYKVNFVVDKVVIATETYTIDDTEITVPTVPAKEGYGAKWEAYVLDGGDKTVNAIYTAGIYTVTFVADGVTVDEVEYTVENTEITVPAVPEKDHYTGEWKAYELTGGDITVNAVYTAIEYKVSFVADGTTVKEVSYTVEDEAIEEPTVPAKAHYENGAWEAYELDGGDKIVNATYTAIEYTITFIVDEEVIAVETFSVEDQEITVPEVPSKVGYSCEWSAYDLNTFENQTVTPVNYTANTYKITYNANNGTCDVTEQEVTYDAEYTLATATAPKLYQEFLGWVDEDGNFVTSEVWNIASDVTLTAVYSEGLTFETLSEVPAYMGKADTTESLAIVELNGSKVLQIKSNDDGSGIANRAPALTVTLEFLASYFEDENVDYIAFDATAGTTTINNFRRVTLRSNGTFATDCYEHDMTYTHDSDGDGVAETYATTGIRADSWKTFYFSRADYNAWVAQGVTSEKFITSGQFNQGDSVYVDNIRPVTAAERKAGVGSLESGGVRINDAGKTLLFYMLDQGTTWQFNMQVGSGVFTNVGYTNETATDGIRALKFTKPAGNLSFNFTSGRTFYNELVTATGYYAVDIYIPEGSDAKISYHTTTWAGVTPKTGAWTTIYVKENNQITVTDTTGGTYFVDHIRSITEAEYNLAALSMEANVSGLRTKELGDNNVQYNDKGEIVGGVSYYYGGADHQANTFSFAIGEGNAETDAAALSNVRLASDNAHSGSYSLAFDKGTGYMYLTMRNDSTAYELLKDGFTFWIYSTVDIDGVDAKNIINGANEKFNGGEGIYIKANTWTQVTVTAADMNPTRFLILQGSFAGTIYLDDFQPLPTTDAE